MSKLFSVSWFIETVLSDIKRLWRNSDTASSTTDKSNATLLFLGKKFLWVAKLLLNDKENWTIPEQLMLIREHVAYKNTDVKRQDFLDFLKIQKIWERDFLIFNYLVDKQRDMRHQFYLFDNTELKTIIESNHYFNKYHHYNNTYDGNREIFREELYRVLGNNNFSPFDLLEPEHFTTQAWRCLTPGKKAKLFIHYFEHNTDTINGILENDTSHQRKQLINIVYKALCNIKNDNEYGKFLPGSQVGCEEFIEKILASSLWKLFSNQQKRNIISADPDTYFNNLSRKKDFSPFDLFNSDHFTSQVWQSLNTNQKSKLLEDYFERNGGINATLESKNQQDKKHLANIAYEILSDKDSNCVGTSSIKKMLNSHLWFLFDTSQKIDILLLRAVDHYPITEKAKERLNLWGMVQDCHFSQLKMKEICKTFIKYNYFSKAGKKQAEDFLRAFTSSSAYASLFHEKNIMRSLCGQAKDYLSRKIDIYAIFDISPKEKNLETIKQIYHTLALKYHPDKEGNAEAFKTIANIKDILLCPKARDVYDRGYAELMRNSPSNDSPPTDFSFKA